MSISGPDTWGQPLLNLDTAKPLFINSVQMEAIYKTYSSELDDDAVFVETLGGGNVHHGTLETVEAPRSLGPSEIEIEVPWYDAG